MAKQKSLIKQADKEIDKQAGWRNIWMIIAIVFSIWLSLLGWSWMQHDEYFNRNFFLPIMSSDIFSFISGFLISVFVIAWMLKNKANKR